MKRIGYLKRSASLSPPIVIIAIMVLLLQVSSASANNCLKDEFGKNVQCTANDVSIAKATNIKALDGTALKSCISGSTFSFVADFLLVTTASARENIGLYFATAGQSSALTGTCSDNISRAERSSALARLRTIRGCLRPSRGRRLNAGVIAGSRSRSPFSRQTSR